MNELVVVLLSSFTTLFAVYLKSKLDEKKEKEIKNDFWDLLKSGDVKKVEIKFKSIEESNFNYISKGSSDSSDLDFPHLRENFIHNDVIGVNIFSENDLSDRQKCAVNKYLNQIERKI